MSVAARQLTQLPRALRFISESRGLSQEEVAGRIRTLGGKGTTSAINNWFAGRVRPSTDALLFFLEACGSSLEELARSFDLPAAKSAGQGAAEHFLELGLSTAAGEEALAEVLRLPNVRAALMDLPRIRQRLEDLENRFEGNPGGDHGEGSAG